MPHDRRHAACSVEVRSEWVRAAQRGDRDAFDRLVEQYQAAIYRTVYRLLENHADAEQVSQDALLQAWLKLKQLTDVRCFGGWLKSVATNTARNAQRMRMRRKTSDIIECDCIADPKQHVPLDRLLVEERAADVQQVLRSLRKQDKEILTEVYLKERSFVEASKYLELPVGTVKSRIHVARKRFAKKFAQAATPTGPVVRRSEPRRRTPSNSRVARGGV